MEWVWIALSMAALTVLGRELVLWRRLEMPAVEPVGRPPRKGLMLLFYCVGTGLIIAAVVAPYVWAPSTRMAAYPFLAGLLIGFWTCAWSSRQDARYRSIGFLMGCGHEVLLPMWFFMFSRFTGGPLNGVVPPSLMAVLALVLVSVGVTVIWDSRRRLPIRVRSVPFPSRFWGVLICLYGSVVAFLGFEAPYALVDPIGERILNWVLVGVVSCAMLLVLGFYLAVTKILRRYVHYLPRDEDHHRYRGSIWSRAEDAASARSARPPAQDPGSAALG